ncbi:hypothetical protein [Acidovorax sp. Q11]
MPYKADLSAFLFEPSFQQLVRPQRRWVEAWAGSDAWKRPSPEQLTEVSTHLSGLPTAVRDDDEDAKRFDAMLLNTQLALLRTEPALARLQTKVQQIANALLKKANIHMLTNTTHTAHAKHHVRLLQAQLRRVHKHQGCKRNALQNAIK